MISHCNNSFNCDQISPAKDDSKVRRSSFEKNRGIDLESRIRDCVFSKNKSSIFPIFSEAVEQNIKLTRRSYLYLIQSAIPTSTQAINTTKIASKRLADRQIKPEPDLRFLVNIYNKALFDRIPLEWKLYETFAIAFKKIGRDDLKQHCIANYTKLQLIARSIYLEKQIHTFSLDSNYTDLYNLFYRAAISNIRLTDSSYLYLIEAGIRYLHKARFFPETSSFVTSFLTSIHIKVMTDKTSPYSGVYQCLARAFIKNQQIEQAQSCYHEQIFNYSTLIHLGRSTPLLKVEEVLKEITSQGLTPSGEILRLVAEIRIQAETIYTQTD